MEYTHVRQWVESNTDESLTVRFESGNRVRIWGGWFQNTYVLVNGVKLAGYIQCKRQQGRMSAHTCFPPLSSAVLGMDWKWLLAMHRQHNEVAVACGFASLKSSETEETDDWTKRVRELEAQGLTTSDAQAVADVEFNKKAGN